VTVTFPTNAIPLEETERALQVLSSEVPGEAPIHVTIVPGRCT
jgi:hypothetical protein